MDFENYKEGQSMQRPPLFESDGFIYWKNIFETYVKSKYLDLWHIIIDGDFPSVVKNATIQAFEVVPFESQDDALKKKHAKNNEAKMLLITHKGNSQVKDNNIDIIVQQYEQFTILEEEAIDSGFVRFNTIITSLKVLDESFSSKNYVRKFLRALHLKWRAKVTIIKESQDLSSLALDELISNLKVHEVIMENDFEAYKGKKKRVKSIALKAKKESSDDETSISGSEGEKYAMAVRDFKKFFRRNGRFVNQPHDEKKSFRKRDKKKDKSDWKCFRSGAPNHLIDECLKLCRGCLGNSTHGFVWSIRYQEGGKLYTLMIVDDYSRYTWTKSLKTKNEAFEQFEILTFCDAQGITHDFSAPYTPQSNGVVERKNRTLQEMARIMLNEQSIPQKFWCNTIDTSTFILNRILIRQILGKTPYEIYRGRKPTLEYFTVFGSNCFILNTKEYLTKFDPKSYEDVFLGYSQNSKAYIILNKHTMKFEESLNVTFDESSPPTKLSPLVDDDIGKEQNVEIK
ncbi:retrovirus-related pol polyprotein from transposon TNT 1-94 [Tanacetum coccineum]|uniref:Retrovirus-related pol polyprotein from transposon TNT 1-94 n=1 Tax=Tanacetum coccineum TaxID=301880 RepID=A0ABQ5IP88_9ASTR